MGEPASFSGSYVATAGFVTTPRYFDPSPQEFLRVAPKAVGVMQRPLEIPGYAYELGQRARNFDQLEQAAICLGECFCQVIGQVGTNWVHCNGTTPAEIRDICERISDKAGARFLMAGLMIVDALNALGVKRIAVANSYYRDDWRDGINRFLVEAGFEILWSGSLVDQGLYRNVAEQEEVERQTLWSYPAKDVVGACVKAAEAAPEAEAVVQTGAGFRTLSNFISSGSLGFYASVLWTASVGDIHATKRF